MRSVVSPMDTEKLPAHPSPYPPPFGRPLPEGKGLCNTREAPTTPHKKEAPISRSLSIGKRGAGWKNQLSIEVARIRSWLTNPVSSSVSLPISKVPVTVMGVS